MKKTTKLISIISCLTIILSIATVSAVSASAESLVNVDVVGSYNYDYAYEVLDLVNDERDSLGLDPLSMDIELLDGAMLRAAETSIVFSHTRPDQTSCFTACNWERAVGENIAGGYLDPNEAMVAWCESSGHYANIISSKFTCVGIGVFTNAEGVIYWSQMFDAAKTYEDPMYTGTDAVSQTILTDPSLLSLTSSLSDDIIDGSKNEESAQVTVNHTDPTFPVNVCISPLSFNFTSSDESIASVDENGKISAHSNGTAEITATLKDDSSISSMTSVRIINTIASVRLHGSVTLGDSDGDGVLAVTDATHIQKWLSMMIDDEKLNTAAADVDHDGDVTILDSTMIQKHCANIITIQ